MTDLWPQLVAFGQVVAIDLVLAGDNAIVVGMAAAGVPREKRATVIFWGIGSAILLRIIFALLTTQLLALIGLTLAGGVLLLWVCWKMFRELQAGGSDEVTPDEALDVPAQNTKSMGTAIGQIVMADLSMSLDNVLAVAGAAKDHPTVLVLGLLLSVALMGAAANAIAHLLHRHRWIGWVGLAIITYVALDMIWRGGHEVIEHTAMFL
ncbi:YjbE family putative metal transport protein [Azospirillum sp. RWY-5-1]|uniref:YjbE family putative metal transport protein n=2 Tax=Azospirillum oleiclasticum TaxID=2735135 RepID=A0ABX2T523_9PROT|nr:YjbE family putative metal transport protein [Azospirillum oleiclasticum]NYZ19314.1 YjbE family putative metal transport protein [Azospirillum oleiclasticum]